MKHIISGLARLGYQRSSHEPYARAGKCERLPTQRDWDRLLQSLDEKDDFIKKQLENVRQQQARLGF